MPTLSWPFKDPNEVLDYQIDWSDRLDGDTIATSTWEFASGDGELEIDSDTHSDELTVVWLSGGTVNTGYRVTNRIVTAANRTMDQTVRLKIRTK